MKGGSEVGEAGGGGFESNLPSRQGWTRSYLTLIQGGATIF